MIQKVVTLLVENVAEFSVTHGGSSDIDKLLESKKHIASDLAAYSSKTISSFFESNVLNKQDLHVSVAEGIWVYHVVRKKTEFPLQRLCLNGN